MSEELVYGASPYGYLTVVPREAAEQRAGRVRSVLGATTYGEARALDAPFADEDVRDDEPYDVRETGAVLDGDWPPNAGMLGQELLPADARALLTPEGSMVGQEWVEFDEQDEQRVVDGLRALGYVVRRDDAFIESLDTLLDE